MTKCCYWCGKDATSKEHAPPKCLFPQSKDTSDGVTRRNQLITVPSCDTHNGEKSHDDEYLLWVLAMTILNNNVGIGLATSKVIRALQNNSRLCGEILNTQMNVVAEDIQSGTVENTIAFQLDNARIVSVLEHIARAIYFHHFGNIWKGSVTCFAEFQMALDKEDAIQTNQKYEKIRAIADELMTVTEKIGSNPDVLYYQLENRLDDAGLMLLRLTFYEGAKAICKFQ